MIHHADRLSLDMGMLLDAIERDGGKLEIIPFGKDGIWVFLRDALEKWRISLEDHGFEEDVDPYDVLYKTKTLWYWKSYTESPVRILYGQKKNMPKHEAHGTFYWATDSMESFEFVGSDWSLVA